MMTLRLFIAALWLLVAAPATAEVDPIALYLTWQRSPDTTMTIQWVTPSESQQDIVEYQRVGESLWKSASGSHQPMPENHPYMIHWVELTQLSPDTDYRFRAGHEGVIYKFRTMPSHLTTPIRFIVGGDFYHDSYERLETMNRQAASCDPMFILAGGDLAYSERSANLSKTMPRWLEWLIAWKKQLVTSSGRLIPLIPAIGNHDADRRHGKTPASAPYFYSLFATPGLPGYKVLDFGDYLSVFLLDSDHTNPIEGKQTEWLKQSLQERQQVPNKLALYHVPAYPAVRDFNNEISSKIRQQWVPLFEKLGLDVAFENHDHAYKRTWRLREGKLDPHGVLYLGDGGWGVDKPRLPRKASKTWYLAKSEASRNFVCVILHDDIRHFIAIDDKGDIIDETVSKMPTLTGAGFLSQ